MNQAQGHITNYTFVPKGARQTCASASEKCSDYYPYGSILRQHINGAQEKYLTTHHERDQETGLDYRGARYYDSDVARFLSLDPAQAEYPAWSSYAYVLGNPISLIDPDGRRVDDIYLNEDGTVREVVRNDQPNRFFDEAGTELKFNDAGGLDSPMLHETFDVGDKVFERMSRTETESALKAAGDIDFKKVNPWIAGDALLFCVRYALASYSSYDFGYSYLRPKVGASPGTMAELYEGSGYVKGVPYFQFEGQDMLYNLPDAGNFMWGKKAFDNHLPKDLMLRAAGANEGGSDTPADTKAILSGYGY